MMELDFVPNDDEIGVYTPLERPTNSVSSIIPNAVPQQIVYSDDDIQNGSSSYDSDEAHTQVVKHKLKRKSPVCNQVSDSGDQVAKKKKFAIWSDILQEEAIDNQFVDSEFFGGSYRGNESYNYRMKHLMDLDANANSRDMEKGNDAVLPRKKLKAWTKNRNNNVKRSPIILPDLDITADDPPKKVAEEIAKKLIESNTEIIERVVNTLGNQKAMDIYYRTKEIERDGGLLILNGSRRRTSGGVYLKLVKDLKLPITDFVAIFRDSNEFVPRKNFKSRNFKQFKGKGKKSSKTKEDLKILPFRYELELSISNDESDTNILKNPPPSPVYLSATSSTNPFSLSDAYPLVPFSSESSLSPSKPRSIATSMPFSPQCYSPPSNSPQSPLYRPYSPTYSPQTSPYPSSTSPSYTPQTPPYPSSTSPSYSLFSPEHSPTS